MPEPRPLLLYLVTEDWFFRSHFLPMARAAREQGFDVAIAARVGAAAEALRHEGMEVIPLDIGRGGVGPLGAAVGLARLVRLLRERRPAVVHMIALRPILLGLVATLSVPGSARVVALTGLGFLGAKGSRGARAIRSALLSLVRPFAGQERSFFLFENPEDQVALESFTGPLPPERVALLPGAGVDAERFRPAPEPPTPVRVALVARMVWSKGVDVAVEAHRLLRAGGHEVELLLAGSPDPENPASIPETTLRAWAAEPGIAWAGRVDDIPALWRAAHVAVLPSRGGEGLPKSLIEAAACGRPIVTTDVPGCRRLVRHEVEGLLVRPDDAPALAAAIARLVEAPELRTRLGAAARARVEEGFTERHVAQLVGTIYAKALRSR